MENGENPLIDRNKNVRGRLRRGYLHYHEANRIA